MGARAIVSWVGVSLLVMVSAAQAETIDPVVEYGRCMTLARDTPEKGLKEATRWESFGGGGPAQHCRATALLGLGHTDEAATILEQLAATWPAAAGVKVGLLQQAADARANAGQDRLALDDLNIALKINPSSADSYEAKALVLIDLGLPDDALAALSAALANQPKRLSALVLRAATYRRLGTLDLSGKDLASAEAISTDDTDLWLEKGQLALALGHREEARRDWLKVLDIRPDGSAAEAARSNLAALDVKQPVSQTSASSAVPPAAK